MIVGCLLSIGPQVNKFEKVSNDDHQMSVAGSVVCPRCDVWGEEVVVGTQVLCGRKAGTLPCTLSHHTCDAASPVTPLVVNRMTLLRSALESSLFMILVLLAGWTLRYMVQD